jgi:hypothetical protein
MSGTSGPDRTGEPSVVTPGDPDAPSPTTHRPGDEEGPTRRDGSQRPPDPDPPEPSDDV